MKINKEFIFVLIFGVLIAGLVVAQVALTSKNIAVSNKAQADRLGEVTATDYVCSNGNCTYVIMRAGSEYARTFASTKDNDNAYDKDIALWYEEMIEKIAPAPSNVATKQINPVQK